MKKLLFAGMVVMGTFAFAACGGSSNTGEGAEGGAAVEDAGTATTDTTTMSTDTTGTGAGTTGTGADSASTTGTGSGQ